MRNASIPLNHSDERPITVPEMLRRWGEESTLVILRTIAESGSVRFCRLCRGWTDNYVLVEDVEVNDFPMLPAVIS